MMEQWRAFQLCNDLERLLWLSGRGQFQFSQGDSALMNPFQATSILRAS